MKQDIPYYANPSDNHCSQACLRMAFEYFNPDKKWSWQEMDSLTGHKPGLMSWNMKAYYETFRLGYDVVIYDPVDFVEFVKDPVNYFRAKFSPAYAEEVFGQTDIPQAVIDAKELLKEKDISLHSRSYELNEFQDLLAHDYLCATWVDMAVTNQVEGECWPHFILAYGYDDRGIWVHDPGGSKERSHMPHRHISWSLFEKANKINVEGERGEMMAFKR
jgi:hypothetical protein